MNRKIAICAAAGALVLGAQQSQAVSLTLQEAGFPAFVINDNDANDQSPGVGSIGWSGVFHDYSFQADSGSTKPAVGTTGIPVLTLANTSVTSAPGAGALTVIISESGFDPGTYDFRSRINGTVAAQNVAFSTRADGNLLQAPFVGGPGPFDSGNLNSVYSSGAPITLDIIAVISQPVTGITLFDANIVGTKRPTTTPDGGATAALLGLGMIGVAAVRRKLS